MELPENLDALRALLHQPLWGNVLAESCTALCFSPDGAKLYAMVSAGEISAFAAGNGSILWSVDGGMLGNLSMSLSKDGSLLAVGTEDGSLILIDAERGELKTTLRFGKAPVTAVVFSPKANRIAVACGKRLLLVNDSGVVEREFPESPSVINTVAWSPKGDVIACAATGAVRIFSPEKTPPVRVFEYNAPLLALSWSPDGSFLVCGCQDDAVRFWKLPQGEFFQMTGYAGKVLSLSWSHDGKRLSTSGSTDVAVWDFSGGGPAGKPPEIYSLHQDLLIAVQFAPSADRFVSISREGSVGFWQSSSKKPLAAALQDAQPLSLAWSPNSERIAIGCIDGTVMVYPFPNK